MKIHRFRDTVAINLDGETRYLKPRDAKKLAQAINSVSRDIKKNAFGCGKDVTNFVIDAAGNEEGKKHEETRK